MEITPDVIIIFQIGAFTINATLFFTWIVMGILVVGSWLITKSLSTEPMMSRGQNLLEVIVEGILNQIDESSEGDPKTYMPLIGTLFLFIFVSNVLSIVPHFHPPTSSLITTSALALCVFFAVPIFGIKRKGVLGYLKHYIRPTIIMLPFNLIGEISRTIALAVRLFGNIMSGTMIVAILLSIIPLFFPILMHALGLITGVIQAYIFAVLAMVYIASASRVQKETEEKVEQQSEERS